MSIGLPIITSNFELYKEVVLGNRVGICVSPTSSIELSEVMTSFINQEYDILGFGKQGVKSVEEKIFLVVRRKKVAKLV